MSNQNIFSSKTLWQSYGKLVLLAVALSLLGYAGWSWKAQHKAEKLEKASSQYSRLVKAIAKQDPSKTEAQIQQLMTEFKDTPYATLSALLQAKLSIEQNQKAKALDYLNQALALAPKGPLEHITRVRLARVLAANQQYDEALNTLSSKKDTAAFASLYEETKGDIYLMQNNIEKAREAYQTAKLSLPPGVKVMTLQLKHDDLNKLEDS